MSILLPVVNCSLACEKTTNSRDFIDEDLKIFERPKNIQNDAKQEYDFKDHEIADIEKLTNSKLLTNIGYGGFSTVKLIYNFSQKSYFAMKVV